MPVVGLGSYTEQVILSISHTLQVSGEAIALNYTAPSGISAYFSPSSPVKVPASGVLNVTVIMSASSKAAVGNDTITLTGVAGSNTQSTSFTLRVVEYKVTMVSDSFTPPVLNVTVGSTVYWQEIDSNSAASSCGAATAFGLHNIVFTTLPVNTSAIPQFQMFGYTFTTPGSYFYYSSLNTDHTMNGTINVLSANGALPMESRMPVFSHFKGGSIAVPAKTATKTPPIAPQSLAPATALALAALLVANALPAILAVTRVGAGASLVVLALLGLALAALGLTRRVVSLGHTHG